MCELFRFIGVNKTWVINNNKKNIIVGNIKVCLKDHMEGIILIFLGVCAKWIIEKCNK
jgi:hypothetical protein